MVNINWVRMRGPSSFFAKRLRIVARSSARVVSENQPTNTPIHENPLYGSDPSEAIEVMLVAIYGFFG